MLPTKELSKYYSTAPIRLYLAEGVKLESDSKTLTEIIKKLLPLLQLKSGDYLQILNLLNTLVLEKEETKCILHTQKLKLCVKPTKIKKIDDFGCCLYFDGGPSTYHIFVSGFELAVECIKTLYFLTEGNKDAVFEMASILSLDPHYPALQKCF
ncbi:hypothetical protein OsccyDRAFT_0547 [Leptolyngbyaceae cyanobacterium JSC-12]|nr:hypothetical protein OsccyDRAFT_0547 [Leptolyngbyaceae cyanobacterium JSC-12]